MSAKTGWTRVAFGDVVRLVRERSAGPESDGFERYVGLEHLDPGDLRIRRWGKVSDGTTFTNVFRAGQVLFGKRRAYQRKVAVADFDGVCSGDIYVFEPKGEGLLPELLPFICQTDPFFEHAIGTSAGSLSPRTNWDSLAEFEFPLPPREKQTVIANALLALDAAVNSLLKLRIAGIHTERSLLDELFDPVLAVEARANRTHRDSSKWLMLGEIAELQPGFAFPSAEFSGTGDRLLRGSNVGVDRIHWPKEETRYWPTSRRGEVSRFVLRAGDVVIAMDRPFIAEGFKVAQMEPSDLPALLLQRVGRFEAPDETARSLVWAFVHSRSFQLQLMAQQEGTDLPHISKSQIDSTLLPRTAVNSPDRWTAYGALHKQRAATEGRLRELKKIRASLLKETQG